VVLGLLCAARAEAWDGRQVASADLSATTSGLAVLTGTADPRVVVVGPARTWLIHPRSGEVLASVAVGGNAVAEGRPGFVFVCAVDGLQRIAVSDAALGEPVVVDPAPCRGLGRVTADKGPLLVAVGDTIRTWPILDDGSFGPVYVIEGSVEGVPLIGVDKRRFAVAARGGASILEEGPWGTSSLATEGPIGGLAAGPSSWAWSHPERNLVVDVTRTALQVAEHPTALAGGDLDGDGTRDLVVAHPRLGKLGVVLGITGTEALVDAPAGVQDVRAADIDGDGCDEIVILTAAGAIRVIEGQCGGPALAVAGADEPGPAGPKQLVIGDTWPVVQVYPGERLDLKLVDALGAATAWAASGGPEGLVVTSSGAVLYQGRGDDIGRWRVAVRLWVNGSWARKGGFELVVRPGVAPGDAPAAGVDRRIGATASDLTLALDEEVGKLERPLAIRGCALGFGGVLGGSQVRSSWVLLGESFVPSASPALSVSCDGGKERGVWWSAGLDAAPCFVYVVNDIELRHGLTSTLALGWTNQELTVGGYGAAGASILGLGPLVRYLPFETPTGARHGPEARFLWMPSTGFIFEGMVLYTVQLGPYR
jgi:hypothetical protein